MNVWESMGKPCSCMQFIKSRILYNKSRENPYQVLQVTCVRLNVLIKWNKMLGRVSIMINRLLTTSLVLKKVPTWEEDWMGHGSDETRISW